jgi:indole-3-glycerol phosphate synthase
MLDKFVLAKQEEIQKLMKLEKTGKFPPIYPGKKIKFSNTLKKQKGIIAEYKKGSPSMGIINPDLDVVSVAESYKKNGAIGISVITEEKYFFSSVEFLEKLAEISLPILRKDFIIDPLQIKYTASTPASAVLLIAKLFREKCEELVRLVDYSHLVGIEPVVEIYDKKELEIARCSGARIILVNNRNLDTLKVDLNVCRNMIEEKEKRELWICASGISSSEEVKEMIGLGFDACLIGTYLMKHKDPGKALSKLIGTS